MPCPPARPTPPRAGNATPKGPHPHPPGPPRAQELDDERRVKRDMHELEENERHMAALAEQVRAAALAGQIGAAAAAAARGM